MISFNVSGVPIYSFFYQLSWLLLLIAEKYLKIPQISSFPKHRSDSELCCISSQQSVSFSAPVAFLFSGLPKEKGSSSMGKSTASWNDCCFFFPLILICKSRCIWVCINWFIACLSWRTLQVHEYAKNRSFLKSFASSGGVFSFPPDSYLLVVLWPAVSCAGWFKCAWDWS